MNGRDISITKQGVFLANTQNMAGSCTNQLEVFKNLTLALHLPIATAFRMLSENPAAFVGLDHVGTVLSFRFAFSLFRFGFV
jgi:N-acetylglucosamine-6-phosphate deacetylase